MPNINNVVTKNFNDNISYLEVSHPELFSKLSALESAIENGHYQEKYELMYDNEYFDVLEKSSGNFLYGEDSYIHADLASKSIDYKLQENLFEGFHKHNISDEELYKYSNEKPFEHQMSGFAPIISYTQENSQKDKTLKSIDKFVFFGSGLGLHIATIDKKISSKVYFIVEDDLELFRLSLFTLNYKEISKNSKLYFSVFEDNNEFHKSAIEFLEYEYYYNHYIKYFHILSHSDEKSKQFHIAVTSQSHLLFFYNSLLTQYLKPLEYLFNEYSFLDKTLTFSDNVLDKKPFLLVAAGPSLQKNIKWLKENHKNFVVVALSATLAILEKEGITPDIITHLDAFVTAKVHFDKLNSLEFIKNSILIYSSRVPKGVVEMFSKKQLFFLENGTQYKENSLKPSAPCIGSLTYQLLLRLNAKNIYLLGLDLAIDKESGKTHSDSHEYGKTLDTKENAFDTSTMTFKESLFNVEGNLSKSVLTTPHFQTSIDAINRSTQILKSEGQSVVNLNDGVKFIDSIPKQIDDIHMNKRFNDIKEYLLEICVKNSSHGFTSSEISKLYEKLEHSKKIHKLLSKYIQIQTLEVSGYLSSLKQLCNQMTNKEDIKKYELSRVIDTYLKYILEYIFDFFNSKELVYSVDDIKTLDELLTSNLNMIINYYRDTLESKLKSFERSKI